MKYKFLLLFGIFACLAVFIIAVIFSYNFGYKKGYIEGYLKVSVGESCTADTDCKTPMEYMIRSNCPFDSRCIENKCNVVCAGPFKTEKDQINNVPQCAQNSDCDCNSFYLGDDIIKCSCLNGLCLAIVSE